MVNMEMHPEMNPEFLLYQNYHLNQKEKKLVGVPRVLIVEDDEVTLAAMRRLIKNYDPTLMVHTAPSLEAAKMEIAVRPPDLLIADFYLEDGATALELLRFAKEVPNPVPETLVMSTGAPLPALFQAEREGLCIKFLKKPVDRMLLYRFLQFDLDQGYYL